MSRVKTAIAYCVTVSSLRFLHTFKTMSFDRSPIIYIFAELLFLNVIVYMKRTKMTHAIAFLLTSPDFKLQISITESIFTCNS